MATRRREHKKESSPHSQWIVRWWRADEQNTRPVLVTKCDADGWITCCAASHKGACDDAVRHVIGTIVASGFAQVKLKSDQEWAIKNLKMPQRATRE